MSHELHQTASHRFFARCDRADCIRTLLFMAVRSKSTHKLQCVCVRSRGTGYRYTRDSLGRRATASTDKPRGSALGVLGRPQSISLVGCNGALRAPIRRCAWTAKLVQVRGLAMQGPLTSSPFFRAVSVGQHNMSIGTDPQQQEAALPHVLLGRSSSR